MATFKVGDRVRLIAFSEHREGLGEYVKIGDHGVIRAKCRWGRDWIVEFPVGECGADSWQLAPLTDPKADAFLESIRQLAKKPVEA